MKFIVTIIRTHSPYCHTSPVLAFSTSTLGVWNKKAKIWCQAYAVSKQPLGCRAPSKINHPYSLQNERKRS